MKIVLGTYEGNLMGWESDYSADASGKTLKLSYAFNAHDSSVRALRCDAIRSDMLVSGGSDETIRIYDLKAHKEIGSLLQHKDAISCLQFFGRSHLISAGRDGSICIWRTSDWVCLDTLKAHKYVANQNGKPGEHVVFADASREAI